MSKFKKLLIVLISILILEVITIYIGYKRNMPTDIKYNSKKPIIILIDVTDNVLSVMQDGKAVKSYMISGGKPSSPSPIGTWRIVSKGEWGAGFGGSWMGFNVPCPTYY